MAPAESLGAWQTDTPADRTRNRTVHCEPLLRHWFEHNGERAQASRLADGPVRSRHGLGSRPPPGNRGRQTACSEAAIQTWLTMKGLFGSPRTARDLGFDRAPGRAMRSGRRKIDVGALVRAMVVYQRPWALTGSLASAVTPDAADAQAAVILQGR